MATGTQTLDGRARELVEAPNFAYVTTLNEDGSPHVLPIWAHVGDDGLVEVNSAEGRVWPTNLERDPRVALVVPDKDNPYEYVEVRGRAVEITPEGADDHIDRLSKKYMGEDEYPFRRPGEVRLLIRIEPQRVRYNGGS